MIPFLTCEVVSCFQIKLTAQEEVALELRANQVGLDLLASWYYDISIHL